MGQWAGGQLLITNARGLDLAKTGLGVPEEFLPSNGGAHLRPAFC